MALIRWAKRLLWLGTGVYLLTLAGVYYSVQQTLADYGDGQHLAAGSGVAVVLGSGASGDGVLDYAARRRVALGVRLLKDGKVDLLVTSGGPERFYDASSGELMKAYAISLGAPADAIAAENEARTTFENLLYSRELLQQQDRKIGVIVTDAFHLTRAAALAWAIGLDPPELAAVASPQSAQREMGATPLLREAGAWWVNVIRLSAWAINGKQWPL